MKYLQPYAAACLAAFALTCTHAHAELLTFNANLDASQVAGGSDSSGTGFASVTIDTTLYTITTDVSWTGLSGPVDRSHMHDGLPGQPSTETFVHEVIDGNSPARTITDGSCTDWQSIYPACAPASSSVHNFLDIVAAGIGLGYGFQDFPTLLNAYESGGMYIDVHTEAFPEGEIRGQLFAAPVPEPASMGLMSVGLIGLVLSSLRQRRGHVAAQS